MNKVNKRKIEWNVIIPPINLWVLFPWLYFIENKKGKEERNEKDL